MLQDHEKQYHLAVTPRQIGGYCLLPGDPGRCQAIAAHLENPYLVSVNREYTIWNGTLDGTLVTVCSTGIGGPSAAIAVEELAACGAHTMIRIGTCGGIALPVRAGELVIASGAVRQEGTSREYAPIEFPALAHYRVLRALTDAAEASDRTYHVGAVQSKDSFYGQHDPHRMPISDQLTAQWEAWKRLGVLASEMETAAIFTVSSALGLRSGAVFLCVWNQERAYAGLDTEADEVHDTEAAISTAIEALRVLIAEDRQKGGPARR